MYIFSLGNNSSKDLVSRNQRESKVKPVLVNKVAISVAKSKILLSDSNLVLLKRREFEWVFNSFFLISLGKDPSNSFSFSFRNKRIVRVNWY